MDATFQLGEASVSDVRRGLSESPSYSAVRTMIGSLEAEGAAKHRRVAIRYVYPPTQSPARANRSALKHLLRTFYNESRAEAVAAIPALPLRKPRLAARFLPLISARE